MDVDENLKQTYIQYDPAPRKGNEVLKKRVPDYFLWGKVMQPDYSSMLSSLWFGMDFKKYGVTGSWTQGLVHAKHALYQLSYNPVILPFISR